MNDKIKMSKKEKDKMNKYLLQEIGYDFERLKYICSQVPIVYCEITGKRCSYAHYPASTIFEAMNDYIEHKQEKLHEKLTMTIADLGLPKRIVEMLSWEKIDFVGELVQGSKLYVQQIPYFGVKSMEKLERALNDIDCSFGMNIHNWVRPKQYEVLLKNK